MARIVFDLALLAFMAVLSFHLGSRWNAYCTKNSIEKTGRATLWYGDHDKVDIVGKIVNKGEGYEPIR